MSGRWPLRMRCHVAPLVGNASAPAATAIVSPKANMSALGRC